MLTTDQCLHFGENTRSYDSKLMVGSEMGNIDQRFDMERISQRQLISSTFAEPARPISIAPCEYLKSENKDSTGHEISESGWTMYLDQTLDCWSDKNGTNQFDIEQKQKKSFQYTEAAEKYPTYDYQASRITDNEDSSMASDASSGPQKPPLPLQDMELEDGLSGGLYFSVSRKKCGFHGKRDGLECTRSKFRKVNKVDDKRENLESTASCSSVDMKLTWNRFRKVNKDEEEHDPARLLQDTASSRIHNLQHTSC